MLRVCLDARLRSGISGGVESVVIGLAHGLSTLTDGDEEYFFLTYSGEDDWLRPYINGSCRLLHVPRVPDLGFVRRTLRLWMPSSLRSAWRQLKNTFDHRPFRIPTSDGTIERAGIDIMHFTFQNGFLTQVPSIYHPHDLQHLHLPQFFTNSERNRREVLYRGLCRQARMVAVAASWGKRDLLLNYGLDEDKVQVVPMAPVLHAYPNPGDQDLVRVKSKFALPEDFVFYPAQTWAHKNHIRLLEALALLRRTYGIIIPFVSSGRTNEYFPIIQKRVQDLVLTDQVRFLGFVSPEELQSLYKLARCVVIPTLFEAASGPLWDAFLSGTPVACSNVTSLPEQAGDAALIFDPTSTLSIAESIWRLWGDESLRRRLADRGRTNVARFSWEHTARVFRAHYRKIVNRHMTNEDIELLSSPPML